MQFSTIGSEPSNLIALPRDVPPSVNLNPINLAAEVSLFTNETIGMLSFKGFKIVKFGPLDERITISFPL